ncbi:DNA polymerase III subunit gamma/tau [Vallitalea pronyensis]|uniref:DNA-directed DNA polymerase n=1 Tax=Vallitalea pronyensis TaxID=1348613 RepID=A0A8J8SFC8_9FIRM|nr:DNA polymerase III subunit gamma/tau [Vallitalea pronyensis]QUI21222.1 DNA polymerase III subunit gamma/tau [Vallitalea pronyensis]
MGYTALYRKWRPKAFEGVMGQEHIVQTIKNQIKADKIAHAYLFCGTRGTGKTTMSKLFGKAVNCLSPVDGSPCNTCAVCEIINENRSMNIIEIDAASNNGVDNIREIREEVKYTPTEGKYKVYIIDEVHMLSTGAFNALLKTLEEPPSHVIFILATTEPHKIPATILSRCQRYDFKRIGISTIAETLTYYMQEEQITIEDKAIRYIAKVADGSMRDALSILDQCIAFYLGQAITLDKVLDILGAVDTQIFIDLMDAIGQKDAKTCMEFIQQMVRQGRDINQFIMDLIGHLRNILVLKSVTDGSQILDMSKENMAAIKEQADHVSEESIIYYIKIFSELEAKIKYASNKRILLEVELMKLCQPSMDNSAMGLLERIKDLEEKLEKGVQVIQTQHQVAHKEPEKKTVPNIKPLSKAVPEDIKEAIKRWENLVEQFSGIGKALMRDAKPTFVEDGWLYIVCKDDVGKKYLSQEEVMDKINTALETMGNKQFDLKIIDSEEYKMLSGEGSSTHTDQVQNNYEGITSKVNLDVEIL